MTIDSVILGIPADTNLRDIMKGIASESEYISMKIQNDNILRIKAFFELADFDSFNDFEKEFKAAFDELPTLWSYVAEDIGIEVS